ncbi:MFS transporter [Ectobacillus ponti]|uniref:MFS transporter n=1 Tax=Ectobacillus ponti TaxID=2961894 RepID=A0AA42BQQ5_9BACI|nr:MFS transporter [Ectobacillus ponti]MCP8970137.1 MFS transporter [Ectobacillus ponti]
MERLWTGAFIRMTVGMLFLFTSFYVLLPTLPLFVKQLGGSTAQVGLTTGTFMLAAVALRPVTGGLLDRFGRRPFLMWGLALFVLAMCLYNWAGAILVLLGLRILHGMSWAVSTTAIFTAITDIIPPARRGEGMGWFSTAMTLAMAVGPLLGIWLKDSLSYHALFLCAACLSAAALLLMLGVRMPFAPQVRTGKMELFEPSVLPIAAAVFLINIAYGSITAFVPLFAGSIKVNSGTFFLVYAATLLLSRPVAGKLSDKRGEAFVIVPSLVITASALVLLGFSTGLFGMLSAAVLYGIGFGAAQPALQAAAIRLARPERKGVANASFLTATDLGIGMGAILLGGVSQYAGYPTLFIISAVLVACSLLVFILLGKRSLGRKETQPLVQYK